MSFTDALKERLLTASPLDLGQIHVYSGPVPASIEAPVRTNQSQFTHRQIARAEMARQTLKNIEELMADSFDGFHVCPLMDKLFEVATSDELNVLLCVGKPYEKSTSLAPDRTGIDLHFRGQVLATGRMIFARGYAKSGALLFQTEIKDRQHVMDGDTLDTSITINIGASP